MDSFKLKTKQHALTLLAIFVTWTAAGSDWTTLTTTADRTTTGQTLVNITDLVTGTLATNTKYEFEARLDVGTSADMTGVEYGVHVTPAPASIAATYFGPTTVSSNLQTMGASGTNADAVASGAFLTTASETGVVNINGMFTTGSSGSPVFSLQHRKVTSGTSTVKQGSVLRYRLAFPIAAGSTLLTGLKAYYALSDLTDSSGNGLTLTNHNSVTFVTGKVGNAANFVSASSQYLSHADAAPYQMGTGSFTVAAWIRFTSIADQQIVGYGQDNPGYGIFQDNGGLISRISDGVNAVQAGGINHYNDGLWHLVVGVADRTNNILHCYIDNNDENPHSIATVTGSPNNSVGFEIGAEGLFFFLDGTVDEVGLWNRVLTSTEISHLWNGGVGTTYPFTGL